MEYLFIFYWALIILGLAALVWFEYRQDKKTTAWISANVPNWEETMASPSEERQKRQERGECNARLHANAKNMYLLLGKLRAHLSDYGYCYATDHALLQEVDTLLTKIAGETPCNR